MKIKLDYVGRGAYHPNDEFTLHARILKEDQKMLTFERYMKQGKVACGSATVPRESFEHYYRKCNPEEIVVINC